MKLRERVHLVGSGSLGLELTESHDCNVYLLDGRTEHALIDAGAGLESGRILDIIRADGVELDKVRHLLITHPHGDHAGGAAAMWRELGEPVAAASAPAGEIISAGDARGASVDSAKKAGFYPEDFVLHPCPVQTRLTPGQEFAVGDLRVIAIATPGHCAGHMSFVVRYERRVLLFAGDAVFPGGRIQLQPIQDCSLQETVETLRRLRTLRPDELYAGHGAPVLDNAWVHIERANEGLDHLRVPAQMAP